MINTALQIKIVNNIDDIAVCYKLRETVFINEQNVPLSRERDEQDECSIHFLIYDDNTPIGTARVFNNKGIAVIGRLCILKEYRGKGIGKILMEEIINHCKQHEFKELELGAQEHAIDFYSKLGFKIGGPKYMDANIAHIKMKLTIGEQNDL